METFAGAELQTAKRMHQLAYLEFLHLRQAGCPPVFPVSELLLCHLPPGHNGVTQTLLLQGSK